MFNFFSSTTPDDVALVAAFLGGIFALVLCVAAGKAIGSAVKVLFTPTSQMARRNH